MNEVSRRAFLGRAGLAAGGLTAGGASLALLAGCTESASPRADDQTAAPLDPQDWDSVRAQFALRTDRMHFAAWGLASPPRVVRDAMALVYSGLRLQPGDEVLTSEQDFYSTQESLRLAAERSGATLRKISLYESPSQASVDEIVSRIVGAITPRTRVLALTWVHCVTGVKLPVAEIATAVAYRAWDLGMQRPLFCLDGVYTHDQVRQLMAGLDAIDGVHVVTPQALELHAGLVCVQVAGGRSPFALADRLLERNSIVSGTTPYRLPYLRLGPSIVTNPDQVDVVIAAIADLL